MKCPAVYKVLYFLTYLSSSTTKPTKWPVCPMKTKISLGIHPVWSESSMSAGIKLGSLATHWAHSEDWSDWVEAQADLSLHWVHRSCCWFCHAATHFCFVSVFPDLNWYQNDNLTFQKLDAQPVKQIRRGIEDNYLGIIFVFFSIKTRCGYSLESPRQANSNEYPQHMFLLRAIENYHLIIINTLQQLLPV